MRKAQSMDTVSDKIAAVVKGPGWFPGTPRLGDPMGAPEVIIKVTKKFKNR